jgi:hypothetical protein
MEKHLEKRLKEIDLEINKLNKLRQSCAHRKKKKTFMMVEENYQETCARKERFDQFNS